MFGARHNTVVLSRCYIVVVVMFNLKCLRGEEEEGNIVLFCRTVSKF